MAILTVVIILLVIMVMSIALMLAELWILDRAGRMQRSSREVGGRELYERLNPYEWDEWEDCNG